MTRTLYVCLGPECSRKGSLDLLRALQIARGPTATDGRLTIRSSGCRSRCADAITLGVFPERRFRQHVRLEDANDVLQACLSDVLPGSEWGEASRLPEFLIRLNQQAAREAAP